MINLPLSAQVTVSRKMHDLHWFSRAIFWRAYIPRCALSAQLSLVSMFQQEHAKYVDTRTIKKKKAAQTTNQRCDAFEEQLSLLSKFRARTYGLLGYSHSSKAEFAIQMSLFGLTMSYHGEEVASQPSPAWSNEKCCWEWSLGLFAVKGILLSYSNCLFFPE